MNDILSLRKEMKDGEIRQAGRKTAFGSDESNSKLWIVRDTVYELLENVRRSTKGLDQAFTKCIPPEMDLDEGISVHDVGDVSKDIGLAGQHWTSYKNGYIRWYLTMKRYGLQAMAQEIKIKS
ncbi:uncharacterized protein N7483_010352 [Penicillium malachiteum]|uniref:uncharacterized protein n=1 Tax=Penicillium malachiteum TaxID=1324776 RepID=UPI002548536F|nr:uncharacterized protein N7483_010352 [Penicillium malachiteum]KAJ5713171.1 hypothetical protein N7483_010352 [Penicillium malachiteum]